MTLCSLCGREAGAMPSLGEPVCRGPVCRWCYESRVMPALRTAEKKAGGEDRKEDGRAAGGAWVVRTHDGLTVSASAWWVAHELASALHPDASEEDVCAMAEDAVRVEPARGSAWDVMGVRVPWMSRVLLQSPARLVPCIDPSDVPASS